MLGFYNPLARSEMYYACSNATRSGAALCGSRQTTSENLMMMIIGHLTTGSGSCSSTQVAVNGSCVTTPAGSKQAVS